MARHSHRWKERRKNTQFQVKIHTKLNPCGLQPGDHQIDPNLLQVTGRMSGRNYFFLFYSASIRVIAEYIHSPSLDYITRRRNRRERENEGKKYQILDTKDSTSVTKEASWLWDLRVVAMLSFIGEIVSFPFPEISECPSPSHNTNIRLRG